MTHGNLVVRRGGPEDAAVAVDVFIDSLTDLYARMSLPVPSFPVEATVAAYRHIAATGFLWIGEVDGAAVAIACGVVRGHVSFLSGFWTRPGHQGRGIGGEVLAAAEADARGLGATTFATWSSLDAGAVAVYLRRGMLPGFPAITLAGRLPARVALRPRARLAGDGLRDVPDERAVRPARAVRGFRPAALLIDRFGAPAVAGRPGRVQPTNAGGRSATNRRITRASRGPASAPAARTSSCVRGTPL